MLKLRKILQICGAMSMALAVFFSSANSPIVFAGHAMPSTVSVERPSWGNVSVNGGSLNVRQTASTNAPIVASLPDDSSIMIVGQEGNFYKVQYNTAGNYGYVSKTYIEFRQQEYYLKVNNISGNLNMRFYASTDAAVVASIPANTSFAYEYDVTDWYCGVYGNQVGSVFGAYVTKYSF